MSDYKRLDKPLEIINEECISRKTDETIKNSDQLVELLDKTISFMKEDDEVFKKLFSEVFYGGSYFDDLKVGKLNEYDIDLKLCVSRKCEKTNRWDSCDCLQVVISNKPGFFWLKLDESHCSSLNRFIKDGYVQTDLVVNWFRRLVMRALARVTGVRVVSQDTGSAVTLGLITAAGYMKVDLMPTFWFNETHWPRSPYKENPSENYSSFLLVPLKPKDIQYATRFWRASFQEQERELINGKKHLKPALRLLKKMRDGLQHSDVPSYALKSIVLRNVDGLRGNTSLGETFVALLKLYRNCLMSKEVPYYWNKRSNVLGGISEEIIKIHCDEISRKMMVFDGKYRDDPWVVAELILKIRSEEYERIKSKYIHPISGVTIASGYSPSSATPSPGSPPSRAAPSYRSPPQSDCNFGSDGGRNLNQQTTSNSWGSTGTAIAVGAAALGAAAVLGAFFRNKKD